MRFLNQSIGSRSVPVDQVGLWLMIVLLLLVCWLGARGLDLDSLWYDEIWSLYYAGGDHYGPLSLSGVIEHVTLQRQHEKNPPGYYLLLNLWGGVVGWTEFAGRSLSLLLGLLAVACTYRLGRALTARGALASRRVVGLGSAVAIGSSAFFIYYLHEMRVYSATVLLAVLVIGCYWKMLHVRQPHFAFRAVFVVSIGSSLYLHYLGALVLAVLALHHLLLVPKNQRWWTITTLALVGGALFVPWLPVLVDAAGRTEGVRPYSLTSPATLSTLLATFSNSSVALLVVLVVAAGQSRGRHIRFVLFLALGGVGLAVLVNAVYPIVTHVRYLIMLWPLLALVVGLGMETLSSRVPSGWLLGVWLAAGLWNIAQPGFAVTMEGVIASWRPFRAELQAHSRLGDLVLFHAPRYYWLREFELDHYTYGLPASYQLLETIPGLEQDSSYETSLRQKLNHSSRVWLAVDRLFPSDFRLAVAENTLKPDYAFCYRAVDQPDLRLDLYTRIPTSDQSLPFRFGDSIHLGLVEPLTVVAGQLWVLAGWSVTADVPLNTYSVALHVEDTLGDLVAQVDYALPVVRYACQVNRVSLFPGTYNLKVAVYNWQTGERLPAQQTGGAEGNDRIVLGTFTVPGS